MNKRGNGRILHLAINEKFIDHAYISFENVAPGQNDFFIFFDEYTSYIKQTPHRVVRYRDRLGFALYREIARYDLVVVHSLHPFWRSVINASAQDVVFIWVGWGYDYYNLLHSDPQQLLLAATRSLTASNSTEPDANNAAEANHHWPTRLRELLETLRGLNSSQYLAIARMALFSPVLPNEYPMVQAAVKDQPFPKPCQWNYGSLEEVLLKGFIGRKCTGDNILLGNSASATSNHADWLHWLAAQRPKSDILLQRQVICPLSYGDKSYADQIKTLGQQLFADKFSALTDFMALADYLDLVASCSHLVMNHVRQQGVGNILIMFYLGATVFIRQENPCYDFFRQLGFVLFSVQQLEQQPTLLQHRLSADEAAQNQRLLFQIWSKQAIDDKTRLLISTAREAKRGHYRME